jgi:hypothetical protein
MLKHAGGLVLLSITLNHCQAPLRAPVARVGYTQGEGARVKSSSMDNDHP